MAVKNVLVLCGGQSVEHEVSLRSARFIVSSLDRKLFKPVIVIISRDGCWNLLADEQQLADLTALNQTGSRFKSVTLKRKPNGAFLVNSNHIAEENIDIAFPILHGFKGEDGTWQGLLDLLNIPYVGSSVLGSAICMNKVVSKTLLAHAGLNVAPSIFIKANSSIPVYEELAINWNVNALFIKPADSGSSVGIRKVRNQQELENAVQHAFKFSQQVIIEGQIIGREVECAVLGGVSNDEPIVSALAEIIPSPKHEFYTYEAKYLDNEGAKVIMPASLPAAITKEVQKVALKAFDILYCSGMARVDFFVTADYQIVINEINTIPGFTAISMYPQLMEHAGINGTDLVSKLLTLATEEFMRKNSLLLNPDIAI
jgi:D-alanine-D-alanine ligase